MSLAGCSAVALLQLFVRANAANDCNDRAPLMIDYNAPAISVTGLSHVVDGIIVQTSTDIGASVGIISRPLTCPAGSHWTDQPSACTPAGTPQINRNKGAKAADRRCPCLLPFPADDESCTLDGAAAQFYTELAICFLRMAFFLRTIVCSVCGMRMLCAVSRFRWHAAKKWPRHKRHRVSRVATGAVFALCIVTSPLSTKSLVCRLYWQSSNIQYVEYIQIAIFHTAFIGVVW